MLTADVNHHRRTFTNGRDQGYAIGRWIDEDGDGRYDVLEVEARGFKGPRSCTASRLPLPCAASVDKASVHLDRTNLIDDASTVIDHALRRPWTVDDRYARARDREQQWPQYFCGEGNLPVFIGERPYVISGWINANWQKPIARSVLVEAQVRR